MLTRVKTVATSAVPATPTASGGASRVGASIHRMAVHAAPVAAPADYGMGASQFDDMNESFEAKVLAEAPAVFDGDLAMAIDTALQTKIQVKKFDYKAKDVQQGDLIKNLRSVLQLSKEKLALAQRTVEEMVNERRVLLHRTRDAQRMYEQLNFKVRTTEEEVAQLRAAASQAQEAALEARQQLAVAQSDLANHTSTRAATEARVQELETVSRELASKLQQSELQLATLRERFKREEELNQELKAKYDSKGKELSTALCTFQSNQERLAQLQQQLSEAVEARHKAELELRDVRTELATIKATMASLQETLTSASSDKAVAMSEREALRATNAALQSQLESVREQLSEAHSMLSQVQAELRTVTTQCALEKEAKEQEAKRRELAEARVESLTTDLSNVRSQLTEVATEAKSLRNELMQSKDDWATQREQLKEQIQTEKTSALEKIRELELHHNEKLTQVEQKHKEALQSLESKSLEQKIELESKLATIKMQAETSESVLREELRLTRESRDNLQREVRDKESQVERLELEVQTLRRNVGVTQEKALENICALELENKHLKMQVADKADVLKKLEEYQALIQTLRNQIFEGEVMRRRMHNTIQELKGNIRVIARVRPLLSHDNETEYCTLEVSADERGLKLYNGGEKPYGFSFDRAFPPTATQEDVFEEVSQLVQSALDGYHVCLFSYGQTGSGKTHTMTGGRGANAGIIPRSVAKILESISIYRQQGWDYQVEASFSEIYNQRLNDLLDDDAAKDPNSKTLEIKRIDNRTVVPGLTRVPVTSSAALEQLMARANNNRATATTDMNERSSRSHLIFTLYIRGVNEEKKMQIEGTLNLCDLAGSERLDRSGVQGDRLRETQAINKSLSCLSDVFQALAKGASHVPFRNSKLTYLLQDCFAGDGKTMMVVNLSPTVASAQESLCSLRFASTVSQVHMGTAKKHVTKIGGSNLGASTTASVASISYAPSVGRSDCDAEDGVECDGTEGEGENESPDAAETSSVGLAGLSLQVKNHGSVAPGPASASAAAAAAPSTSASFKRPPPRAVPSYMQATSASSALRRPATAAATTTRTSTALAKPRTFNGITR